MPPNFFLAYPVELAGWPENFPQPPPAIRAFAPSDLHCTIAFLGPVSESVAGRVWQSTAVPFAATRVGLGRVRAMGNPRRYSALSATLSEGGDEVASTVAALRSAALVVAGLPPAPRPPLPHVTLARPERSASQADAAHGLAWAEGLALDRTYLALDRIALYTWSTSRERQLFQIVCERSLPRPEG